MLAAAEGPSLALTGWAAWLVAAGALATAGLAIAQFWRKVLHPMLRVGAVIEESFPVWVSIAKQYSDNTGQETLSREIGGLAANQQTATAILQSHGAKLDTVTAQNELLGTRVQELDVKLGETRHAIIGVDAALTGADGASMTVIEKLIDTSRELVTVNEQLVEVKRNLEALLEPREGS